MRFVRFADDRTGVLADRRGDAVVVDLAEAAGDPVGPLGIALADEKRRGWAALIERWPGVAAEAADVVEAALAASDRKVVHDLRAIRLRAPLPSATARIFALGVNFRAHVSTAAHAVGQSDPTADDTRPPAGFFVIPGTVVGPDEPVELPPDAQKVDYEAEVAVVLATGGRDLDPADVRIWGHTGFNDLSIRDPHLGLSRLDEGALAWGLQKNFHGGNVLGPWIAVDEGFDLTDLRITSSVGGDLRQDGCTAQMIRSFAEVAAYLSRYLELQPGDILTSGTPGGTAIEQGLNGPYLQPGDVIEVAIEGAGVLRTPIVGLRAG